MWGNRERERERESERESNTIIGKIYWAPGIAYEPALHFAL